MNQKQREFLIERVNKTFDAQVREINAEKTKAPSLNNYLIAAFLDNSIQFNDIDVLKNKIREQVLKMGSGNVLIHENKERYLMGNDVFAGRNTCEVIAEDLFIIPESYKIALEEYNSKMEEIRKRVNALQAQKDTIILKIQIGSDAILDKLISQADNLADLSLMNNHLLIS